MTTAAVDTRSPDFTALIEAGKSYDVLNQLLGHLAAEPRDVQARLFAAREFVRIGLGAPARECLDAAGRAVHAHPDFVAAIDGISPALGRASWIARRDRWSANLDAAARSGIDVETIRRRWGEVRKQYELFRDLHGNHQVRYRPVSGPAVWLPHLGNHKQLAEQAPLPQDCEQMMPGPYAFEGIDLGWYFERLWRATQDTFLGFSCALYVVEPEPALLAVAMHLHDWRELLSDQRVKWFFGSPCTEQFVQALLVNDDLPAPRQVYRLNLHRPAPEPDVCSAARSILETRDGRATEDIAAIEAQYRDRDAAYWAKRFAEALAGDGAPLRILATVSTHTTFLQYSMRDTQRAAEQLGHTFRILTESTPYEVLGPSTYHSAIREFDPDLFFILDRIRPSFRGILPANLPLMTWDQDALPEVFTAETVKQMSPLDTVVGLPKYDCLAHFGCDPRQFLVVQMPTSPERFDAQSLGEDDLAPYRCAISYVSHSAGTPQAFHESELTTYDNEHARRLLDDLYRAATEAMRSSLPIKGQTLRRLVEQSEARTGVRVVDRAVRDRLVGWYLWRLCDRMFRQQALEWAADWARRRGLSFRLYGNDWEKHPTLSPFAAGPAANDRELACVYRASTINLQLMPAGFLHQRALDGLAAGGFFLTRMTDGDVRDSRHRDLLGGLESKRITTSLDLKQSGDSDLLTRVRDVHAGLSFPSEALDETLTFLQVDGQRDYAAEVFPRFSEITFSDAESFAAAADRFLEDADERRAITESMRNVVVKRYSYPATLAKFLRFAADSFASLARDGERTESVVR